jgi:hypothetical protein
MLPGAALVALLVGSGIIGPILILFPLDEPVAQFAAFLLAAYAAGHLVFLLAAFLDETLYYPVRCYFWPDQNGDAYHQAGVLRQAAIGGTAALPMNTFSWAKSYLMLHWPAAAADVQRYEADSKFFRSMVLLLLVLVSMLAWKGELWLAGAALLLLVGSFWRYAERRYKSTEWAYRHVIVHLARGDATVGLNVVPPETVGASAEAAG